MTKKILLIIVLAVFLLERTYSQDFWEILNSPPDINIQSVGVNSNGDIYIGIFYTTGGGLYKSTDNGVSWELLGFENKGVGLIEINELGYIYVYGGGVANAISRSMNNGQTWEVLYESIQGGSSIKSHPDGLMFATGGTGNYVNVIRSVNYGDTWEEVLIFPSNTEYPSDFIIQNNDTIYIGTINWTGGGGVYRSVDGGDIWEHIGLTDHYVSSLAMNSSGDLLAGTRGHYSLYEGGVYILPNGQTEWINLNNQELVTSMVINSDDEIYIGCSTLDFVWGGVRRSIDNGQTWVDISQVAMYNHDIESLILDTEEYLFALEYNSTTPLYKSINSTITTINNKPIGQNVTTYNYPNPFCVYTTIEFITKEKAMVNLILVDTRGNTVKTLIKNQSFASGEHQIKWYADNDAGQKAPDGIYFYKLSSGNDLLVKKAILIR